MTPAPLPMAVPVTFWFEFASTYSWLAAMRIEDAARQAGVPLVWRPFLLGPIFAAQGWNDSPFNIYPAKGRYMWRDLERRAEARGLPFRRPAIFPQNSLLAARIATAALARPEGPAFVRAVYGAEFGRGAHIADPATVATCLGEAGLPASLIETAADPAVKAALRQTTEDAAALGLFGAPSFTVGGEIFWGDDRLDDALAWAAGG